MKRLLRPGPLLGALAAVLLVLAGVAAWHLARLGSGALAAVVALAGLAAVVVVGFAWWLARDVEQELRDILPPLPETPSQPTPVKRAFRVREARPGEIPEAYLAAVRKGAQAREAAWKASAPAPAPSDPHAS